MRVVYAYRFASTGNRIPMWICGPESANDAANKHYMHCFSFTSITVDVNIMAGRDGRILPRHLPYVFKHPAIAMIHEMMQFAIQEYENSPIARLDKAFAAL